MQRKKGIHPEFDAETISLFNKMEEVKELCVH